MTARRLGLGIARRSVAAASGLASSHVIHLALNLWLLHAIGPELFGQIGLAKAGALLLVFAGELGYGTYFTREVAVADDEHWQAEWRGALFLRLVALACGAVTLLVVWRVAYPAQNGGWIFLLAATPGILLSAFNFAPVLYGLRRAGRASAAQPLLWGTHAAITIPAIALTDRALWPVVIGASLSVGYLVQAIYFLPQAPSPKLFVPKVRLRGGTMHRSGANMSGAALAGALYDRLILVIIEHNAPMLLPFYIIIDQILNGLNTLIAQTQRVMLPEFSSIQPHEVILLYETAQTITRPLIGGLYVSLLLASLVASDLKFYPPQTAGALMLLTLAASDWYARASSAMAVPALSARRDEAYLFKVLLIVCGISAALQLASTQYTSVIGALLIRTSASIIIISLYSRKLYGFLRFPSYTITLLIIGGSSLWVHLHAPPLAYGILSTSLAVLAAICGRKFVGSLWPPRDRP